VGPVSRRIPLARIIHEWQPSTAAVPLRCAERLCLSAPDVALAEATPRHREVEAAAFDRIESTQRKAGGFPHSGGGEAAKFINHPDSTPVKALLLCYPLVCLLLGTVSGSASWPREAAMYALVVGALAAALVSVKRQQRWPRVGGWFEPALVLLLTASAAGAVRSPCAGRSWRMVVLWAAAAAVFYLVVAAAAESEKFRFGWVLPVTGTAAALVGLVVYAAGGTPRVAAPLGHHNYMAGFLLLHLPLTAEGGAAARSRAMRLVWYGAAAAQALAIVLTGSLAGVCVLAGLAVFFGVRQLAAAFVGAGLALPEDGRGKPRPYIHRRHAAAVAALFLSLHGLLVLFVARSPVVGGLWDRSAAILGERRDPSLSLENRLRHFRTGLAMAADRPLLGWGLGATPFVAAVYREQTPGVMPPGEVLRQLHNLPVNLLAETGALGLVAALMLALGALWARTASASLALWAYLFFSLSDYQLDLPAILLPLATGSGLAVGANVRSSSKIEPGPFARWLALGALFSLAATGAVMLARTSVAHYHYQHGNPARAALWDAQCGFYAFRLGARDDQLGQAEPARRAYLEAAERSPDLVPLAAQAGSALAREGQYTEANAWLERATALDYYFTLAHFHLGRARLRLGDRAGAIEAFSTSLLVQPATVLAEDWLSPPERDVYSESLERALDKLYELAARYPASGPVRRWNELGSYLAGRRDLLPSGPHRVAFFELLDRDLTVNHSLIVFRRAGAPLAVAPVVLFSPTPNPRAPAGLGAIEGLPSFHAPDRLRGSPQSHRAHRDRLFDLGL